MSIRNCNIIYMTEKKYFTSTIKKRRRRSSAGVLRKEIQKHYKIKFWTKKWLKLQATQITALIVYSAFLLL